MSEGTPYDKVWEEYTVSELPTSQTQLLCGLHPIHEVTSPQASGMLQERDLEAVCPNRTHVTVDHIVSTSDQPRPSCDDAVEEMMAEPEQNVHEAGINFSDPTSGEQGIVRVIGSEKRLTQPGTTTVCGDSHTSTHGVFGAPAFGIGTNQIHDVLATQTVTVERKKVRKVEITGELGPDVETKDVILETIRRLGIEDGVGYVYGYAGEAIGDFNMEGRISICGMSIESGARVGYINPDETTYEQLKKAEYFQENPERFDELKPYWEFIRPDEDTEYDDVVTTDGSELEPVATWGTTPGQGVGIAQSIPAPEDLPEGKQETARTAREHMGVMPDETMEGYEIDVAFLGSCTNACLPDLRRVAGTVKGRQVADSVRAMVVPGSQRVKAVAEAEGLDEVFKEAGFEWREAGCSMCLGMNKDQPEGDEASTSSSNHNFIGRQGSKDGRTVLMNPRMVTVAAVTGEVTDVCELKGATTV